ncbi:Tim44 domain-containing protein [Megalodesulfovibrio paquesii]
MGDIIWIILLLVMAWFLFARPKDGVDDESDAPPAPKPGGRPSPSDLRPPSRHTPASSSAPPQQPAKTAPEEEPGPREVSEAYRRAQAMWDALRSSPPDPRAAKAGSPATNSAGSSGGFDQDDFLQGARMAYARIQESWDARDLADIRDFVDDQVLANLQELAAKDPAPSTTTILTLDAAFLDLDRERGQDGEREVASVRFRVRMAKGDKPPYIVEEIWHFGRDAATAEIPAGMWKVVGISQVA